MLLSVANSRQRNIETPRAGNLFPETIQESASLLISFIEKYYEYLNSQGLPSFELENLTSEKDIDLVSDKYLTEIQSLIARNVPESTVLDKVSLYRIILQYYRTRGSEDSVYAFFKLFFNEFIRIFYPRDYLFELSQGRGAWSDIDFSSLRVASTNPNKTRMLIESDVEIAPVRNGYNQNSVELKYFDDGVWTYDGGPVNTQFPYLIKQEISSGTFRWKFGYLDLVVFSDNDSVWPDEADWSAFEHTLIYNSDGITKNLQYDSGNTWNRLGESIFGTEINSPLGNSVSLSADGMRMAIGSTYIGEDGGGFGHSRVYEFDAVSSDWIQIGQDLTSSIDSSNIGYSLLLSADGSRVAVTASDPIASEVGDDYGSTKIYEYLPGESRWKQLGQTIAPYDILADNEFVTQDFKNLIVEQTDIEDPLYGSKFITEGSGITGEIQFLGTHIAYSGDGSTVAISYLFDSSITIIYRYNLRERRWDQLGGNINATQTADYSGYSMSLNSNGTILAIGSPKYDSDSIDSGKVTVYRFDGNAWQLYGNSLVPDTNDNDEYGFSIALNSEGNRLAVGTIRGDKQSSESSGYTQIYEYTAETATWSQLGQTIYGDRDGDMTGYAVALNFSGNICAIGARSSDYYGYDSYANLNDSGSVRVYQYEFGEWTQLSNTITGEFSDAYTASSISLSSDGLTLAVSSLGYQGTESGSVDVYRLDAVRDLTFLNRISVSAVSEFGQSYGEIINSLENWPSSNTLYEIVSLDPIVWQQTDITKQWISYDRKSFLSDSYKLHDGYYWQKYSYDIKTSKPAAEWLDSYLKFVHPAGLQLFASILVQLAASNEWKNYIDYSAPQPQKNFNWLITQRAPAVGAHTPFYQPGWLDSGARLLQLLIQVLRPSETERNLYNLVYHIIGLHCSNSNFRSNASRVDYQRWLKFWDTGELISGYSDKTIEQATQDYAFNNVCKFDNVAVSVLVMSDGRYLESSYLRSLENNSTRLTESRNVEYMYINPYLQLEDGTNTLTEQDDFDEELTLEKF